MIRKFRIGTGWIQSLRPGAAWYAASCLTLLAHASLLAFVVRPTAAPRVLHYTTVFGPDLVGSGTRLFLLPAVGLAVLVVNISLAMMLRRDASVKLIPIGTFIVQLALATATLAIVRQTAL